MKKSILFLSLALLSITGCSKTWSGAVQDSGAMWDNTRDAIHEATAPEGGVAQVECVSTSTSLTRLDESSPVAKVNTSTTDSLPVITPPKEDLEVITPVIR